MHGQNFSHLIIRGKDFSHFIIRGQDFSHLIIRRQYFSHLIILGQEYSILIYLNHRNMHSIVMKINMPTTNMNVLGKIKVKAILQTRP